MKYYSRYIKPEQVKQLVDFGHMIKLFDRYVNWITNEDNTSNDKPTQFEEYGERLRAKARNMNIPFSMNIAKKIEEKILFKINNTNEIRLKVGFSKRFKRAK